MLAKIFCEILYQKWECKPALHAGISSLAHVPNKMAAVSVNGDVVKKEVVESGEEKRNQDISSKKAEDKSSKTRRVSEFTGRRQCTVQRADLSWRK